MPKYDPRVVMNSDDLRSLAAAIRQIADAHERLAGWMDTDGITEIDPLMLPTWADGMVSLSSFFAEAARAYVQRGSMSGLGDIGGLKELLQEKTRRTKEVVKLAMKSVLDEERRRAAADIEAVVEDAQRDADEKRKQRKNAKPAK
jgi:hypothetical protein